MLKDRLWRIEDIQNDIFMVGKLCMSILKITIKTSCILFLFIIVGGCSRNYTSTHIIELPDKILSDKIVSVNTGKALKYTIKYSSPIADDFKKISFQFKLKSYEVKSTLKLRELVYEKESKRHTEEISELVNAHEPSNYSQSRKNLHHIWFGLGQETASILSEKRSSPTWSDPRESISFLNVNISQTKHYGGAIQPDLIKSDFVHLISRRRPEILKNNSEPLTVSAFDDPTNQHVLHPLESLFSNKRSESSQKLDAQLLEFIKQDNVTLEKVRHQIAKLNIAFDTFNDERRTSNEKDIEPTIIKIEAPLWLKLETSSEGDRLSVKLTSLDNKYFFEKPTKKNLGIKHNNLRRGCNRPIRDYLKKRFVEIKLHHPNKQIDIVEIPYFDAQRVLDVTYYCEASLEDKERSFLFGEVEFDNVPEGFEYYFHERNSKWKAHFSEVVAGEHFVQVTNGQKKKIISIEVKANQTTSVSLKAVFEP